MYKRRSLLFLPASQPQYYDKIDRGEVCPDAIIFDLEDSIPAAHKQTARQELARRFGGYRGAGFELVIRINDLRSPFWRDDLELVRALAPHAVMIAKTEGDDAAVLERALGGAGEINLMVLIETIRGYFDAEAILGGSSRISALVFGAEDFSADMGIQRQEYEDNPIYLQVITRLILLARCHDVDFIDSVYPYLSTDESLRGLFNEAHLTKKMGADGKLLVHPGHTETINRVFTPNARELERAKDILARLLEAEAERGLSVIRYGDRMMDTPEKRRLKRMLKRFERFAD